MKAPEMKILSRSAKLIVVSSATVTRLKYTLRKSKLGNWRCDCPAYLYRQKYREEGCKHMHLAKVA